MLRHKAALFCKRIKVRHTFDNIASEIDSIHSFYGLSFTIIASVTDNSSNFVKAFQMYQPPESDLEDMVDDEVTWDKHGRCAR